MEKQINETSADVEMNAEDLNGVSAPESVDSEDAVTFEELGLNEYTLKAVEKKGFKVPSPIQVLAIPRLLNGDANLIARARTGTGKTAAFGLPIMQSISGKTDKPQALVLEPTRELAMQTCTEMQSFNSEAFPRTCVLYGGASYTTQIKELKRGAEIVVGTPGRIKDHIDRKTLDLSQIKYFILDEGDEMLDMGFIDDIEEIFTHANPDCRILLFSATMPPEILKIASKFMGEYETIEEEGVIDEPLLIEQKYWCVRESEKIEALVRLIDISPDFYGLVFTQTKMDADRVTRELDLKGYEAAALHGDIMQNQREKVLERFRLKKTRILVATDVAARGIDISGLSHVVNYSLPFDAATYVHRIGRTGRAGSSGVAITFVKPEERRRLSFLLKGVAKASKGEMTEGKIPSVEEVIATKEKRLFDELKEKLFDTKPVENQSDEVAAKETEADAQNDSQPDSDAQIALDAEETVKTLKPWLLNERFTALASELCKNQEPEQVVSALLSILYGDKLSPKHYGKINSKEFGPRENQTRIFVSLGKRDGFRAKEIADYFSNLLHIPGRMVDNIDVAQQFSLVSLPVASAKKAIEMSKLNHKLPHMHIDSKEEGGSRRSRKGRSHSDFDGMEEGFSRKSRSSSRRGGFEEFARSSRKEGRSKGSRPNVHNQNERSSSRSANKSASAFIKKSGKKAERF